MYRKVFSLTLFTAEENTAMYCLMHPARLQSELLQFVRTVQKAFLRG